MDVPLPAELASVPKLALEDYIQACARRCLSAFVSNLELAFRQSGQPGPGPGVLEAVSAETMRSLFAAAIGAQDTMVIPMDNDVPRQLELRFAHDCKNIGCANPACLLCANNQNRRCREGCNFSAKYIKNDLLRARCDAGVRVELVDAASGKVVEENVELAVTIMDATDYAKRTDAGADPDLAVAQATRVYANGKGDPLLIATGAVYTDKKSVVVQMVRGHGMLPDLRVADSSEALRGRGAAFRLLVEAGQPDVGGCPVRYALSEPFQVLSNRSKPNCKPEIPHVEDPVKNVEAIGDATVPKLERLREAAREMNIDLPQVPYESITKVGEFRELVKMAATDRNLQDKLRKVLSLTKDQWKLAYEHALKAVHPDHRLRIWYPDSQAPEVGLVFECVQGNVLLDRPVGMKLPEGLRLEAHLASDPQERQRIKQRMESLLPAARADWFVEGHGNWATFLMPEEARAQVLGLPYAPPVSPNMADTVMHHHQPQASGLSAGNAGGGMHMGGTGVGHDSSQYYSGAGGGAGTGGMGGGGGGSTRRTPSPRPGGSPNTSMRKMMRVTGGMESGSGGASAFEFARHGMQGIGTGGIGGGGGYGALAAGPSPLVMPTQQQAQVDFAGQMAAVVHQRMHMLHQQQAAAAAQQQQAAAQRTANLLAPDGSSLQWSSRSSGMSNSSNAAGTGTGTPTGAHAGGAGDGYSAFENPGSQFQAMLEGFLSQQAPSLQAAAGGGGMRGGGGIDDDDQEGLKRKASRQLSELFTSMSLQALANQVEQQGQLAAAANNAAMGGGGSAGGTLASMPTGNMLELLKSIGSLPPGAAAALRGEATAAATATAGGGHHGGGGGGHHHGGAGGGGGHHGSGDGGLPDATGELPTSGMGSLPLFPSNTPMGFDQAFFQSLLGSAALGGGGGGGGLPGLAGGMSAGMASGGLGAAMASGGLGGLLSSVGGGGGGGMTAGGLGAGGSVGGGLGADGSSCRWPLADMVMMMPEGAAAAAAAEADAHAQQQHAQQQQQHGRGGQ